MTHHSTPQTPKIRWSMVCAVLDALCVCAVGETDGGMGAECPIMKPARLLNG